MHFWNNVCTKFNLSLLYFLQSENAIKNIINEGIQPLPPWNPPEMVSEKTSEQSHGIELQKLNGILPNIIRPIKHT